MDAAQISRALADARRTGQHIAHVPVNEVPEFRKQVRAQARREGMRVRTIDAGNGEVFILDPEREPTRIELAAISMVTRIGPPGHVPPSYEEALEIARREEIRAVD